MTQHLSEADVRGIAEYTRIGLDAEEVVAMTADLNAIIDSLAPITEFDLDGVEPTFHPIGEPVQRHARGRGSRNRSRRRLRWRTRRSSRTAASSSRPSWAKGAIAMVRAPPE